MRPSYDMTNYLLSKRDASVAEHTFTNSSKTRSCHKATLQKQREWVDAKLVKGAGAGRSVEEYLLKNTSHSQTFQDEPQYLTLCLISLLL